ncbi:hypothetical protein AGMMS50230_17660 [Spirochaetia bacterium]|nr:hypothetical protein AGMMS50230_17660 [Spirochaetia bacterium]
MDKVIEQLKKLYTQRKGLDKKISALETKLISAAKTAAKAKTAVKTKVSKVTSAARGRGRKAAKTIRAKAGL